MLSLAKIAITMNKTAEIWENHWWNRLKGHEAVTGALFLC